MTEARIGRTLADSTPHWPAPPKPPKGAPNILVVLFDDVGFSDFGCYGSPIRTPTIDALAADGLRYTGFHTTAMCSTTRAALLTGRNHHSVGMGCLANFDSGYPGYRGKIAREAGTLPEMLKPHGYRSYMVGKWHATPLTETGPTGPFDGWPLGRGFDRFYGFMDAETDQYAPELVRDNTPIDPPDGGYEAGYHLTADLVDQSIRYIADHTADAPETPWLLWLAFGACHAPHQAPQEIIRSYDPVFEHGWDVEREQRLARQKAMGITPAETRMPTRNDGVKGWEEHSDDERRVFTRLQSAFAGMLDHADQHLARLIGFLETAGIKDDTLILVLSDNGASQEGGPLGMVNAMGPYNMKGEPMGEKLARIDDIGGPDTHSNFPHGWAMASNTPLRRYKQNTHGGGIRDPLVISWKNGLPARGELRHQFAHASDFAPTVLDLLGLEPPAQVWGVPQMSMEGVSFAASLKDPAAPARGRPQYFEMFGHRGLWKDGWKAVAFHPPGRPFDADQWELYHLDRDFSEVEDLAQAEPERLKALIDLWWAEAERCKVLPLDDRFGPRFAENAIRYHGPRKRFVFHRGMGHLPTDMAPDVRSRSYRIEADALIPPEGAEGVLIAHGDATCGYSLYLQGGHLHHTINVGGAKATVTSEAKIPPGRRKLGVGVRQGDGRTFTLTVDGKPAGQVHTHLGFATFVSWSGLDIGRDRGSPVADYAAPFSFTGALKTVVVTMDEDQALDAEAVGEAEMARQ
ncbi:arylsulfatase [Phenylobacterium aquaticum]|uniref:arylsulfatase n=1 Tax=Phenylobacterium aquaticum TaxID=1763816 RepID=UPI001F5DE8C0|nr:arylsulfatase [Phenylobacterium aquaticum]MCI3131683.1 arylsulfatase [Phenylobacterium aquaticum]